MPQKKAAINRTSIKSTRSPLSITRAREILKEEGKNLSDEQVQGLIDYLFAMAEIEVEFMEQVKAREKERQL